MIGKRLAVRGLEALCRVMWGFPPTIITLIVDHMGPMRAIGWFATHMPRFLASRVVLGPVRVHLACIVVSLRNGCSYCAYGHVYALELLYLRQHGRLFPLDAKALDEWYSLDARALRNRLRTVLVTAGLHTEAIWVDRMVALAEGSQTPVDAAEVRLAHVIRMADTASRIAAADNATPDEAHDPVNKDAAVKARHAALRSAAPI
jgi:alkylhydroperoxidase family enzyme